MQEQSTPMRQPQTLNLESTRINPNNLRPHPVYYKDIQPAIQLHEDDKNVRNTSCTSMEYIYIIFFLHHIDLYTGN